MLSPLIRQAVNLERYPIDAPEGAGYRNLIETCRADMARSGACVLEEFLLTDALPRIVGEVEPHLDGAFFKPKTHNPYLIADDPDLPSDHARNRRQATNSATLGYDRIPTDSILSTIYSWDPYVDFVAEALGFDKLYPYADPLAPLNILIYNEGCQTGWHFDVAKFVVTLTLQVGEGGGAFEYAPFIRSVEDENYAAVDDVLEERSDAVHELRQPAGALVLFRGNRTLHRVTPVSGARRRLVGVCSYSPEPGTMLDEHTRRIFYGRAA